MKQVHCLAACGILLALSLAQASFSGPSDGLPKDEAKRGLAIAPVTLDLHGKKKNLVGKGSYIVNAQGGCNDCHTAPSYTPTGDPHNGDPEQINADHYLAGGGVFGPFTSRNLTPDSQGRPAGMTLAEFRTALRTGKDLSNNTLQVMPWPVYGKMTDQDIAAVYEYLRAIPHAEPASAQ